MFRKIIAHTSRQSRFFLSIGACSLLLLPDVVFAATFKDLVKQFLGILSLLVPVIIGLTFIALMWGVIKGWIIEGGSAEGATSGRQVALWGVIGLVVMVCMWGLVALIRSSLGFS